MSASHSNAHHVCALSGPRSDYFASLAITRSALACGVPADQGVGHGIGRGEIRFEIEQRSAVHAIEADDKKFVALDAWVGPHRRAQRKRAVVLGVPPLGEVPALF
jgi:hypothetical protein